MKTLILLLSFVVVNPVSANFESYDEIVDKLSKYKEDTDLPAQAYRSEVRTYSRAHIGLGLAQSFFDADAAALDSRMQNQGGLLINVGVDILNERWGIEGSFANFGRARTDNSDIRLREFSLRGLYKPSINKTWSMRMGLGFSSRFLDISNEAINRSFRTPSGLFLVGVDSHINSFISVGADFSFKTAMISDTIDNNSVDLSFRVDTHF